MSLVWTWQFQSPSPPTTTIESPISPQPCLKSVDPVVDEVEEVHHLIPLLADVELAVNSRRTVGNRRELLVGEPDRIVVVGIGLGQRSTVDHVQCCIEEEQVAGPAGVDHAGVLQHREQLGCVVERTLAGLASSAQGVDERRIVRRRGLGRLGALAYDGEDRALDRLEHGLVGTDRSGAQRLGDLVAGALRLLLERGGHPAQDLAEDDPAVAAGPHQRAVADRVTGGLEVGRIGTLHLGHHGVERAGHVGAGVAVGHGIHVEPVEPAGVVAHGVAERRDHVAERVDVEPFERGHPIRLTARPHHGLASGSGLTTSSPSLWPAVGWSVPDSRGESRSRAR